MGDSNRDIINELIEMLYSDDLMELSHALRINVAGAISDGRTLPRLEELLHDERLCMVGIPIAYGEVRYLAAYALYAERTLCNIPTPVILSNVVRPLSLEEINSLCYQHNITRVHLTPIERLEILVQQNLAPRRPLYLVPEIEQSDSQ